MKVTDVKHGYRGSKNASFDKIKKELLELLENAKQQGVVDKEVIPYLDLINSHPDYVTSSSCYGRIVLMDLPSFSKKDAEFLWKSHSIVDLEKAWTALNEANGSFIWFKMDGLILHVSCRDIEAANAFLKVKAAAGLKRGGIFSIAPERVQIELAGTSRMDVPVKKDERLLVDKKYFSCLIEQANNKFEKNEKMWERFAEEFSTRFKS